VTRVVDRYWARLAWWTLVAMVVFALALVAWLVVLGANGAV